VRVCAGSPRWKPVLKPVLTVADVAEVWVVNRYLKSKGSMGLLDSSL
jgi:hypothetical protein